MNTNTGPALFEQSDYTVYVHANVGSRIELRHEDPVVQQQFAYQENERVATALINFRSDVGRSRFELFVDGSREFAFEVEVFPSKLDYETDYKEMLADVQEILSSLAYEYLRSTFRLGGEYSVPTPSRVEWLTLLRSVANDLERSVRYIAIRPHRRVIREPQSTKSWRVRRPDSTVRAAVRRGAGAGEAAPLGDFTVRQRIPARTATETLDTPEHRWLAAALRSIVQDLASLRAIHLEDEGLRARRALSEIEHLRTRVANLLKLEPLAASTGDPPANFSSLQLMRLTGYREAYRAALILRLGLRLDGGAMRLKLKEVSTLYEYWCYLTLTRLLTEELKTPALLTDLFQVQSAGLRVQLARGQETAIVFRRGERRVRLVYNPQYGGEGLLVAQQPDIVLEIQDVGWPNLRLVLDAKYRVDASPEYITKYRSPGPPDESLNVLHRYRDALLELVPGSDDRPYKHTVVQGAVLFPYRERERGDFARTKLWSALERLGIGAIPLLPGSEDPYLRLWLRAALDHGGWHLADLAMSHWSSDRARESRAAANEQVLLFDHLSAAAISEVELAVPFSAVDADTLLRVDWVGVANWVDRHIRLPWVRRVREIAISQGADGPLVRYVLGDLMSVQWRELSGPSPLGFPIHTSRLALERARHAEQLAIRTEAEWRLLEELEALGLSVSLTAAPDGAVWILSPNLTRARHLGASGFVVRRSDGSELVLKQMTDVLDALSTTAVN